ncbi:hypothetical protein RND81_03G108600 [Saponaria officinalis]|uniref:Agglutinin domain-containing protein n=1 Tax=Saponaria officinalis TaxID=3572 RepID=A0AAW1M633_SAPOF
MAYFSSMALKATQGNNETQNYLGVISDGEYQGHLDYTTPEVLNVNAKFAVEYAHDGLVHIRSCSTNKYWVRSSTDGYWIMAKASEPLDDASAWNCTLFRMDLISDDNQATFYHVQSKTTLRIPNDDSDRKMFLCIDPSATTEAISIAIDLDTIATLPKYVAFKADNGLFFDYSTFMFSSDDSGISTCMNEIETTKDGYIRIKQKGDTETYWIFVGNTLLIRMANIPELMKYSLFSVVKLNGNNTIALRHVASNKFCRRGDPQKGTDCVLAAASSVVREAQFEVVECAFSRTVQVLEFDLDKSRIYNLTPISSDTHTYDNPTDQEQEATMNLVISTTKTTTWNNSVSVSAGVETTFKTGVPFIADGSITVSAETSYSHDFGGSTEETQEVGDTYTVKVPPMKRVTGRGMATKGTCDVPFTYTQVDHLTDGTIERRTLSDGIFTGVNAYNFYQDVHNEDVPEELKLKFAKAKSAA